MMSVHQQNDFVDPSGTLCNDTWWEKVSLLPFKERCSINISGATGSGKTYWIYRLLRHLKGMFKGQPPKKVLYCYGVYQSLYDDMEENVPGIEMHEGLPTPGELDQISENGHHNLVVIDDLIGQMVKNTDMELLLTRGCHHKNFSVIYLTQNLFQPGKNARTIALNTWYLVMFRNLRDASQIGYLAKQLFPGRAGVLKEAYEYATKEPYGYLIIDSSPHADSKYRLRTKVFPNEDPVVYVPKV